MHNRLLPGRKLRATQLVALRFRALLYADSRAISAKDLGASLGCLLRVLALWQRQTQSNNEVIADGDLRDTLSIQTIDPLRSSSTLKVIVTELSEIVRAPTVHRALTRQDDRQAIPRDLVVEDVQLVDALDSVRRVELAKDATSPYEHLVVSR